MKKLNSIPDTMETIYNHIKDKITNSQKLELMINKKKLIKCFQDPYLPADQEDCKKCVLNKTKLIDHISATWQVQSYNSIGGYNVSATSFAMPTVQEIECESDIFTDDEITRFIDNCEDYFV